MIKKLDWDSNFFGFNVGLVRIEDEPDWGSFLTEFKRALQAYKLVYFITSDHFFIPDHILDEHNGKFLNQRIVFEKSVSNLKQKFPSHIKEYFSAESNENLIRLALVSGQYSRFRIDPDIPTGKFEELYRFWIIRSLKKIIADTVIVSELNQKINGMATFKYDGDICNIGLVAVGDSERGKGTGKYLINKIEELAFEKGLDKLRVPTQSNNKGAYAFYEKLGFMPLEITNYYHFWVK